MSHPPTSELVARAWLSLAVPGVRNGYRLPPVDDALRTDGFIRTQAVGGSANRYVPMRSPIVVAECWVASAASGAQRVPWNRAGSLAEQVRSATYDPALMGVWLDLTGFGDYPPVLLRTVIALSEPLRVDDPSTEFARCDLDLQLAWTT